MSIEYQRALHFPDESRELAARVAAEAALVDEVVVVEEVRDKQVLIRVSEVQREQWRECAEADGLSVSEWLRGLADERWRAVFTCQHPLESRRSYPWAESCLACGERLR